MTEAATIRFTDLEANGSAVAIIRYDHAMVGVCLSHDSNGEIEVSMEKEKSRALMDALKVAVA